MALNDEATQVSSRAIRSVLRRSSRLRWVIVSIVAENWASGANKVRMIHQVAKLRISIPRGRVIRRKVRKVATMESPSVSFSARVILKVVSNA